jgi:AcrR family transcriptional regulator
MDHREEKRNLLIEKTAKYILKNGLYNLSLRPLAVYLETSDRMILHYFTNKEELILSALEQILKDSIQLVKSQTGQRMSVQDFIQQLPDLISNENYKQLFNVWLELATYQNSNIQLDKVYIESMVQMIREWITHSLDLKENDDRTGMVDFIFVMIEGMILLNAYGLGNVISSSQDWILKNLNLTQVSR